LTERARGKPPGAGAGKRERRPAARRKADLAAAALAAKKAGQPVLLDLRRLTAIADYFLICHGRARPHVQALADAVAEALNEQGIAPHAVEGYQQARWVLMDYGDLIVHVFAQSEREYFDLERLWGDAPRTEMAAHEPRAAGR
jgi:ribosome-associated protein